MAKQSLDMESETSIEENKYRYSIDASSDGYPERDEQEEALIASGGHKNHTYQPKDLYSLSRKSPLFSGTVLLLGAAAVVIFLTICGIIVDWTGLSTQPAEAPLDALTIPEVVVAVPSTPSHGGNYILDSSWDFSAKPQRREYQWEVRDVNFNPDGVWRPMMLINNQFPGPLIEVNEGDTIIINVDNQAINATSIHWHGLYQNGTNWMDGTVGITNCPIAPGAQFTYEFKVDGQSGTYWYHSHHGAQSSDGLHGPFIIHSKEEKQMQKIEYDTDRVVMVSDYYHDISSDLLMRYLASDAENVEPVPDGALINGRGIRDCSTVPHRRCDNTTSNVGQPRMTLSNNKAHRLRVINVGAFAEFQFSIDEKEFAVTEVDGTDVLPAYYNRLTINPAQRYSIILSMQDQKEEQSWWLRAKMLQTCFGEPNEFTITDALAIIEHQFEGTESTSTQTPMSRDWEEGIDLECRDMNTTDLVPVQVIPAPSKSDTTIRLRANFEIGAWRLSRGFFNSSTWTPNVASPSLHRYLDGTATHNTSFSAPNSSTTTFINSAAFSTSTELVLQTTGIQIVDIYISNFDDGNHPLHLHGYKFFVLAQGHGYPPVDLAPDLSNPLRRDTASVEAFGWTLIRLVADNPGAWAFHCHVTWHTEAGLLMQLLTRSDTLQGSELPRQNRELCDAPVAELVKGGTPRDEVFYGEER